MRIAFALAAAAIAVGPAFAAPPHYKVAAHFDPQGEVDADVTITLSEGETEKAILLSRRLAVEPMALPPGVTVTVGHDEEPMPALNKYVFHFADPATETVEIRFRYAGPINNEHDSGNKRLRPEHDELFVEHKWY